MFLSSGTYWVRFQYFFIKSQHKKQTPVYFYVGAFNLDKGQSVPLRFNDLKERGILH